MSDLREKCIQAAAEAEWPWEAEAVIAANWRPYGVRKVKEEIARNELDAILAVLAEHADEWVNQIRTSDPALNVSRRVTADSLLAVLEGDQ